MTRKLVDSPGLYEGVPYSYAAVAPGGTVFTAGACPINAEGLHAAGCRLEDVVKTTVYRLAVVGAVLAAGAWVVWVELLSSAGG